MDVKGAKALSERLAEAARNVEPTTREAWPSRPTCVLSGEVSRGHAGRDMANTVVRLTAHRRQ
jgi:hypothetical protein